MVHDANTLSRSRQNNLDTLRLLLAFLVVLEHCNNLFHSALNDSTRFSFFLLNLSDVAVSCFFVISGMLTWISFNRDPDIVRFYMRRFVRVFPAYWSVVTIQISAFVLLASSAIQWNNLFSYTIYNFITANFLRPSFIEGVPAINGSLWTIKIEVGYYVVLPFIFFFLSRWHWLLLIGLLSFIWATSLESATLAKQLPGKLYLFAIGVALAQVYLRITMRQSLVALLLVPMGVALKFTTEEMLRWGEISEAALGVCLVIAFRHAWMKRELIDISYTLYLVHYPIIVLVTRILLAGQEFWVILFVAVFASIAAAVAISLAIERPALRFGRSVVAQSGKARDKASKLRTENS